MASFAYPPLLSPVEHARDFLPPVLRTSPFFEWVQTLIAPFARVDAELAEYVSGLAYPALASGASLDALGSWVGEERGGLTEWEYRRIVLGALSARAARLEWTDATAIAFVEALTGSTGVTARTTSAGWLRLEAGLTWTPSIDWLTRASALARRTVRDGLMFEVVLVPAGGMIWTGSPGWNTGLWSAVLSRGVL